MTKITRGSTATIAVLSSPRDLTIAVSRTVNAENDILGLSSATIQALELHSNQHVLVESVVEDGGGADRGRKLRTVLTVGILENDDALACISDDTRQNIGAIPGNLITLRPLKSVPQITKVTIGPTSTVENFPDDIVNDVLRPYFKSHRRPIHVHNRFSVSHNKKRIVFQILGITNADYGVVESDTEICLTGSRVQSAELDFNAALGSRDGEPTSDQPRPAGPTRVELEDVECEGGIQLIVAGPGTKLKAKNVKCGPGSLQVIGAVPDASLSALMKELWPH